MPILFYGSQVWRCVKEEMRRVAVPYNIAFRRFYLKKILVSLASTVLLCFYCH